MTVYLSSVASVDYDNLPPMEKLMGRNIMDSLQIGILKYEDGIPFKVNGEEARIFAAGKANIWVMKYQNDLMIFSVTQSAESLGVLGFYR